MEITVLRVPGASPWWVRSMELRKESSGGGSDVRVQEECNVKGVRGDGQGQYGLVKVA